MRLVVESLPVRPGHSRDAPVTWTSSRRFVLVAATKVEFFNSTGWALELTRWRGGRYRVRRTRHCWS